MEMEQKQVTKYWIAKVTNDDWFEYALKNKIWLTQQRYNIQQNSAVTNILKQIKLVDENDLLFLSYGNKVCACGNVLNTSNKATPNISNLGRVIKNNKHDFYEGVVKFDDTDVFYEELNEDCQNCGQRIAVKNWSFYCKNSNVTTNGITGEIKTGISQMSLFQIREHFALELKNSLEEQYYKQNPNLQIMKDLKKLLESCKNLIFTGAPGTGKTYLAKQIAKQIIGVTTDEDLEKSEQFAFVQFHPSYDYTDFVEGLRPTKPDDNGNIGFELKDGVFKEFCKKAREKGSMTRLDDAIEKFKEECSDKMVKVKNKSGYEFSVTYRDGITFRVRSDKSEAEDGKDFPANIESVKRLYQGIEEGIYNKTYVWGILEYLKNKYNVSEYQEDKSDKKYVFVIDEINRGEISKIFGELFFSIDPSYRGEKGAVATQYSNMHETNEKFYVPENVYIIGTMNDIDRSVESFDFAMRRRFTWEEIAAEKSQTMFEGEIWKDEAIKRMNNLNNAIIWNEKEKKGIEGLNSSYHIGAAYFKNNLPKYDDGEKWEKLWKHHLCPLLFEYLRGMSEADKKLEDLKKAYDA